MVGRVKVEEVGKSQLVTGDLVKCSLMFNTVRRDNWERVYTMSEAGYSTLIEGLMESKNLFSKS